MEHIIRVTDSATSEVIIEEAYENACEAYMRYHLHMMRVSKGENLGQAVTIDSYSKKFKCNR